MVTFDLGLLADNAHVDASGKLYVLGEFRYIFAATVPARHGHFAVVARWFAETVEVQGKQNLIELEMVEMDGVPILPRSPKIPINFIPVGPIERGKSQAQLILNLDGLILPKYGDYAIHFFVNETHAGRVNFHVAPPRTTNPPVAVPDAGE